MTGYPATSQGAAGWMSVCLLLALVVSGQQAQAVGPTEVCDLIFTENVTIRNVPVSRTVEQQSKGLAERSDAGPGMLFSWERAEPRVFWMHNTRIPLSIGFLSNNGTLFAIEDMEAETDTYHFSMKPATDALELPKGEFAKIGLRMGSRLTRRECRSIK